jgi:hypothetical protein
MQSLGDITGYVELANGKEREEIAASEWRLGCHFQPRIEAHRTKMR